MTAAVKANDLELLKDLIPKWSSPMDRGMPFAEAAKQGNMEAMEILLPHVDPKWKESKALSNAAAGGHIEAIEYLLPISNIEEAEPLVWAAAAGQVDAIELLSDPSLYPEVVDAPYEKAYLQAALNGRLDSMKTLEEEFYPLNLTGSRDLKNTAMSHAMYKNHGHIVEHVADDLSNEELDHWLEYGKRHARNGTDFLQTIKNGRDLWEAATLGDIDEFKRLKPLSSEHYIEVAIESVLSRAVHHEEFDLLEEILILDKEQAIRSAVYSGDYKVVEKLISLSGIEDLHLLSGGLNSEWNEDSVLHFESIIEERKTIIQKEHIDKALGRDPQALAQAAIDGDEETFKRYVSNADREMLLTAIETVANSTDGDQKHSALTMLACEASNDTLKTATIQASNRGDEDALKTFNSVIENRAMQIQTQEQQHAIENPARQRSS